MNRIFTALALVVCSMTAVAQVPRSKHIYVVALENKSYEHLVGSSNMPYLNSLIKKGTLATQFYANRHNSITDYFLLSSGAVPTTNNATTSTYDVDNIARHAMNLGRTFKVYAQSLPYTGYAGVTSGSYLKRHTALPYYTDMGNSTTEMQKLEGIGHLSSDISNSALPNFGFITPDAYHDLHNCPNGEAACEQLADSFLKTYIAPLLATAAFQPGGDGLLMIWSDEADLYNDDRCSATVSTGCGGRVMVMIIGPKVKVGYKSTMTYHHQHALKTLLEAMGTTSNFPGLSATASPMSDFFVSTASSINTGLTITSPVAGSTDSSPVHVAASSTQSGITGTKVYVDGVAKYSTSVSSVNAYVSMGSGTHSVVVKNWNTTGATTSKSVSITVK